LYDPQSSDKLPSRRRAASGEIMRLHCQFSAPIARTELDDYIRHLEISIGCFDEDFGNEYTVGKLAMDQILWLDAQVDSVSLFEVCDNDSQGMHEIHTILTKGKQEFRSDLRINQVTSHVMFLYGAVFHPSIHACRCGILDAAFTLLGQESLVVMWRDTSGLSGAELADLGFRMIAGSELIFRHSARRTPFSDRFPTGQDTELTAEPEFEEWVEKEWKRFSGPAGG
jgi:hypothetical protein